jgi:hypothetical protein
MRDGNHPNLIGDGHEHDAVPKLLQNELSIVEGDLDEWPKWCETDRLRGAMVADR